MHWSVTRAPVGAFVPHIIFVALLAPLVDGYMVGPEGCGTTKPIKIADDTVTDISDLEDDSRCVFTKNPEAIQKHMDEAAKGVAAWAKFGPWTDCTTFCDTGTRTRYRECMVDGEPAPTPSACGGAPARQTLDCNKVLCLFWSDYGEWGDCDKTCGGGNRTKSVTCMRTDPDTGVVATFSPEEDCGEKPEDQAEECGTDPCIQALPSDIQGIQDEKYGFVIKCDPACANPNINYTIEGSDITLVEHAIHDAEVADGTGTKLCSGDNSTPMSCPAITATTISAVLEVKTGPSTASSSNLIKLEVIEADGMTVRSEMVTTAP